MAFHQSLHCLLTREKKIPVFLMTLENKSAAGMQHTPPRDIFNAKKIILQLDLFMQSLKKIGKKNAKDRE